MKNLDQLGTVINYKNFVVFFGNQNGSLEELQKIFPHLYLLKQVHGDLLIRGQKTITEADAHWTDQNDEALAIKSADCMPIMVCSPQNNIALAIHSGWRGVLQKITSKSILNLSLKADPDLKVFIGPHIQKTSFEVDADVATQLFTAHNLHVDSLGNLSSADPTFTHYLEDFAPGEIASKKNNKFYVNLSALVLWDLYHLGVCPHQISLSPVDTKTDINYYSFRRGEKDVRNYSLIVQLDP